MRGSNERERTGSFFVYPGVPALRRHRRQFFVFFSLSQCARLQGFLSVDGYVALKDFLDPAWMFSGRFFMEKKEAFCAGVKEIKVFGNTRAGARRGYF